VTSSIGRFDQMIGDRKDGEGEGNRDEDGDGHVGTPAARWRRIHASRAKGRDARLVNAAAAELRAQRLEESHSNPL
jgi:hypothetical protein